MNNLDKSSFPVSKIIFFSFIFSANQTADYGHIIPSQQLSFYHCSDFTAAQIDLEKFILKVSGYCIITFFKKFKYFSGIVIENVDLFYYV